MASPYWHETLVTCGVVGGWMVASGGIVLFNKWVMVEFDFHFPATLTFMHMASSWLMANFLCKICAVVPLPELSWTQVPFPLRLWEETSLPQRPAEFCLTTQHLRGGGGSDTPPPPRPPPLK